MKDIFNGKKVHLIDTDYEFCKSLASQFGQKGTLTVSYTVKALFANCAKQEFDLIVCEDTVGAQSLGELLRQIKQFHPLAKVFISSAKPKIRQVVIAIKNGADNFLEKPFTLDALAVALATPLTSSKQEAASTASASGLWATSNEQMKSAIQDIKTIADTDYTVIINGKSGTGKEMVARRIHELSTKRKGPFIAVDCGTLSDELASSELFGHVKGSFTGAIDDQTGSFELAHGGTLFLDEIGNLSTSVQVLLLRALQEKKVRKIGSNTIKDIDIRLVVASNEDLYDLCKKGRFREDLYHRLNEFKITLPSLAERKSDIRPLAVFLLRQIAAELDKEIPAVQEEVWEYLEAYPWSGNIRELKNVLRRSFLLSTQRTITLAALPPELIKCNDCHETPTDDKQPPAGNRSPKELRTIIAIREKQLIEDALKLTRHNKTKAALTLRIDRKTLYNKIRELKIMTAKRDFAAI